MFNQAFLSAKDYKPEDSGISDRISTLTLEQSIHGKSRTTSYEIFELAMMQGFQNEEATQLTSFLRE